MKIKSFNYWALIFGLFLSQAVTAGDFQEGNGYGTIKLEMFSWKSTKIYDFDGEKKDRVDQNHFLTNLKGQYGISKHINLMASLPYQSNTANSSGETSNQSAMGDVLLGLRYSFTVQQPFAISISFNQSFATSDYDNGLYGQNTGYGDNNQSIDIDLAFKHEDLFYATISGGGILHHKGIGDAITGKLELGYQPLKEFWITCFVGGVQPLENGDDEKYNQLGLYSNNAGWFSVQPEIAWKHKSGFGIFVGYDIRFKGQWIEVCNTMKFGLFYKIQPSDKTE